MSYRLTEVVAGSGVTIWTADFLYPPDYSGTRTPPSGVWLLRESAGRVAERRFTYAE